jgi:hypothetical protein
MAIDPNIPSTISPIVDAEQAKKNQAARAQIEKDGFLNNLVRFSIILRIKSIRSADLTTSSANEVFSNYM